MGFSAEMDSVCSPLASAGTPTGRLLGVCWCLAVLALVGMLVGMGLPKIVAVLQAALG